MKRLFLSVLLGLCLPTLQAATGPATPIKVACIGDSITFGTATGDKAHNSRLPQEERDKKGTAMLAKEAYSGITGDDGGLRMPATYGDRMVLQRDVPLRISGWADAGESVRVEFAGQVRRATASNRGTWSVCFEPMDAARGLKLTVETRGTSIEYHDVAIGEVWLCSGQSNMRFQLDESCDAPPADSLDCDDIRLFDMRGRWNTDNRTWPRSVADSVNRLQYFAPTAWQPCTAQTAMKFSAVGYHFAKMLQDSLQVPVGILCNAVGGATTESWIDRQRLETRFPAILTDWLRNDLIQDWARERAAKNMAASESRLIRHPYEPCYLFESAIRPLERYPVRGVIWYQGESNAHNITAHERLFRLLVESWRSYWRNPQMPIHFVQLSSLSRPLWGWFRDSQRRLSDELEHCGMAVSLDRGDSLDVHPRRKADIGRRLARLALFNDYGFGITPSGPLFERAERNGRKVHVTFRHGEGLRGSDGTIRGFELAGEDQIFHPASARVTGRGVEVTSKNVPHPLYVRYAWAPYTTANLVNADRLPASTFRERIAQ